MKMCLIAVPTNDKWRIASSQSTPIPKEAGIRPDQPRPLMAPTTNGNKDVISSKKNNQLNEILFHEIIG